MLKRLVYKSSVPLSIFCRSLRFMLDKTPCPGCELPGGVFLCLTFDRAIPYNESPTVRMGDLFICLSQRAQSISAPVGALF